MGTNGKWVATARLFIHIYNINCAWCECDVGALWRGTYRGERVLAYKAYIGASTMIGIQEELLLLILQCLTT